MMTPEYVRLLQEITVSDAFAAIRLFRSVQGYQKVLHSQELGKIHITDHALVVEGHIIRPKRKKHH